MFSNLFKWIRTAGCAVLIALLLSGGFASAQLIDAPHPASGGASAPADPSATQVTPLPSHVDTESALHPHDPSIPDGTQHGKVSDQNGGLFYEISVLHDPASIGAALLMCVVLWFGIRALLAQWRNSDGRRGGWGR